MLRYPTVALVVALAGCRTDPGAYEVREVEREPPSLVITVDASATAGDEVPYTTQFVWDDGETLDAEAQLTSDLEPTLIATGELLYPTVAGAHTLTAAASYDGDAFTGTAVLDVLAGEAAELDLALSDISMAAGDSLLYTTWAWDIYGNEVDSASTVLTVDGEIELLGDGETGTLEGTLPGVYTLSAELGTASDVEEFLVVPGPTASVELSLSDEDVELFETTSAIVATWDAFGNQTTDPWTVSVEGDGASVVSYRNVTFYDEGWYTVWVNVDGTGLWDSVGPLLIDSTGPQLDVTEPQRGDWVEGYTGTVMGTAVDDWSGVSRLTVNGTEVSVGSDGAFMTTETYDFGMNIVETTATDGDGNSTTDTRALLAGDFLDYGNGDPAGLLVRIHEGPGGFDTLESLGEGLISAADLDDLIPYPAYSASSESCYSVLWWEVCVTWYSVNLYITSPSIGSTDLEIDPTSSGYLDTTMTIYNPRLNWSASGKVVGVSYSGSGTITASSISVEMLLEPYVSAGQLYVDVASVSAWSSGFDFDMDGWLYDVLDFFGIPMDTWVEGYMTDALEGAVYDSVPEVLESALADLEIGSTFDVMGGSYDFDAIPYDVDVDNTGMTLALETYFTAQSWVIPDVGLGSLYGAYSEPTFTGSPGMILGLSEDFLNQALYAFWGGGLLNMNMSGDELGVSVDDLSTFLPALTELNITTEALLPPVVVPGSGSSLLDLQLGDFLLTLYNGPAEEGYEMIQVYVSLEAGLELSATSDATLSASIGEPTLWFDVVVPEANTGGSEDIEGLLEALMPYLLPTITEAVSEIAIPEISGFTLDGISVSLAGAESGYVDLGGNLVAD